MEDRVAIQTDDLKTDKTFRAGITVLVQVLIANKLHFTLRFTSWSTLSLFVLFLRFPRPVSQTAAAVTAV